MRTKNDNDRPWVRGGQGRTDEEVVETATSLAGIALAVVVSALVWVLVWRWLA